MKKGILFLGCSFTWGEGLYFYSGLADDILKENHYFIHKELRDCHHEFRKKYRFPRLVADALDTWEWTSDIGNGGSNMTHYNYVVHENLKWNNIKYEDFGLFVWQLTSPVRDYPGGYEKMAMFNDDEHKQIIEEEVKTHILYVNRIAKEFERRGIKVLILSWPKDYEIHPDCPQEFKDRMVHFEFEGNTYRNLDELIRKHPIKDDAGYNIPPISIMDDFGPKGYQKNDSHLNLRGHEIVKEGILKKLEQDNFKL